MAVKIVGRRAGVRALLKDPGVQADLRRRAERVAAAAPGEHNVHSEVGKNRARAAVVTADRTAREDEADRRGLTRAVDAARS